MKHLLLTLCLTLSSLTYAANSTQTIKAVVSAITPLAQSGVEKYKVKPGKTVKGMLLDMAISQDYVSDESDFSWVGDSNDAWEADSTNWGETSYGEALAYVTELDDDYMSTLSDKEQENILKQVEVAKKTFSTLKNAKVLFGIVPIGGAVQCGVTLAGLAIMDPTTGEIYVFAKEGSGC